MLTKDQIKRYLQEMNDRLAEKDVEGEVVLCGGAMMALVYDARPSTKDVDALFAPTSAIREVAKEIAEEHGLEDDWFNDAAKGFIDTNLMVFEDVMTFSHLRVSARETRKCSRSSWPPHARTASTPTTRSS